MNEGQRWLTHNPGKTYKESVMSSSDIKHAPRKHLKAAGLKQKLTPHI